MDWSKPKRLYELPPFQVTNVSSADEEGTVSIAGVFKSLDGVTEGPGWLLWWGPDGYEAVRGRVTRLSSETGEAVFSARTDDVNEWPRGETRYLKNLWQPHHVFGISVPTWKWERQTFKAGDAIASRRRPEDAAFLPTAEAAQFWVELKSVARPEKSRLYPNRDLPDGLIIGGWDHEHCEFCQKNIDPGQVGYVDRGGNWLCNDCWQQYL